MSRFTPIPLLTSCTPKLLPNEPRRYLGEKDSWWKGLPRKMGVLVFSENMAITCKNVNMRLKHVCKATQHGTKSLAYCLYDETETTCTCGKKKHPPVSYDNPCLCHQLRCFNQGWPRQTSRDEVVEPREKGSWAAEDHMDGSQRKWVNRYLNRNAAWMCHNTWSTYVLFYICRYVNK